MARHLGPFRRRRAADLWSGFIIHHVVPVLRPKDIPFHLYVKFPLLNKSSSNGFNKYKGFYSFPKLYKSIGNVLLGQTNGPANLVILLPAVPSRDCI